MTRCVQAEEAHAIAVASTEQIVAAQVEEAEARLPRTLLRNASSHHCFTADIGRNARDRERYVADVRLLRGISGGNRTTATVSVVD